MERNPVASLAQKLNIKPASPNFRTLQCFFNEYYKEAEDELQETMQQIHELREENDNQSVLLQEAQKRTDFLVTQMCEINEKSKVFQNQISALKNENFTLGQQIEYQRSQLWTYGNSNVNLSDTLTKALAQRDLFRANYLACLNAFQDSHSPKIFEETLEAVGAQTDKLALILRTCIGISSASPPMAEIAMPASPAEPETPKSTEWDSKPDSKNSDLTETNLRLRQCVADLSAEAEALSLFAEDVCLDSTLLHKRVLDLVRENDQLENDIAQRGETARLLLDDSLSRNLELAVERSRCADLAAAVDRRFEEAAAVRADLEAERAAHLWVRAQYETEIKAMAERVEYFKTELEAERGRGEAERARAVDAAKKESKTEICNLQKQLDDVRSKNARLEKDNKYYLDGFKTHAARLRQEMAEFAVACNRRVDAVADDMCKCKARQNEAVDAAYREIQRVKLYNKKQREAIQYLQVKLETFENGSKRERDEFAITRDAYEAQLAELRAQLDIWKQVEERHMSTEPLAQQVAASYDRANGHLAAMAGRQQEIDGLRAQLDQAQRALKKRDAEARKLAEIKEENELRIVGLTAELDRLASRGRRGRRTGPTAADIAGELQHAVMTSETASEAKQKLEAAGWRVEGNGKVVVTDLREFAEAPAETLELLHAA